MIIPVIRYILDNYTVNNHWPSMAAGDVGGEIQIWAYPYLALQYTGTPTDDVEKPWPILDILGTNEGSDTVPATCWGVIATIIPPDPELMFDRVHDPIISLNDCPRVLRIKPVMRPMADANKASLFLLTSRAWGPRA